MTDEVKKLEVRTIDRTSKDLPELLRLYRSAFPLIERVDFDIYLDDPIGNLEILGFYDRDLSDGAGSFCGFAALMTYGDLSQILYFAIEEGLRGRGYGAAALRAMRDHFRDGRIMADLEDPLSGNGDPAERLRRIGFYERNGYVLTDVRFEWEHEDYVMMISGGTLSMAEYEAFWKRAEQDRGPGYERMDREEAP